MQANTRRGKRQRRAALGGDSERIERSEPSDNIDLEG
jgi:hypothetical protein